MDNFAGIGARKLVLVAVALALFRSACMSAFATEESEQPFSFVCRLEPTSQGFSYHIDIPLESREVIFKKEPDFGGREVARGALPIGSGRDFVGFAWDPDAHTLYVDQNRNLDLTDDPSGVYQTGGIRGFQQFMVLFEPTRDGIPLTYVISMEFSAESGCSATIESGWVGKLVLNGQRYWLAVVDNMDGSIGSGDGFGLERSGRRSGKPLAWDTEDSSIPKHLFLEGHNYQLAYEFESAGEPGALVATLTENTATLGELRIEGQFIQGLTLVEPTASSLIVLTPPEPTVRVPAGSYVVKRIALNGGFGHRPALSPLQAVVDPVRPAVLKLGGPLEHKIGVARVGNTLELKYDLVGVGGESYQIALSGIGKTGFSIYKGDKKIGSGMFEYG